MTVFEAYLHNTDIEVYEAIILAFNHSHKCTSVWKQSSRNICT